MSGRYWMDCPACKELIPYTDDDIPFCECGWGADKGDSMKQIQSKPLDEKRWLAIVEMRNTLETVAAMLKAVADNYDRAMAPEVTGESWQIGDHRLRVVSNTHRHDSKSNVISDRVYEVEEDD